MKCEYQKQDPENSDKLLCCNSKSDRFECECRSICPISSGAEDREIERAFRQKAACLGGVMGQPFSGANQKPARSEMDILYLAPIQKDIK